MRRWNLLAAAMLAFIGVSAGTGFAQNHYIMLSRVTEGMATPAAARPATRGPRRGAAANLPPASIPPTLDRELMRQALLMAAREGLGLFTRDEILGETLPAGSDASSTVALQVLAGTRAARLTVSFTSSSQPQSLDITVAGLGESQERGGMGFAADLPKLAEKAESLSRTTFAEWLKSAGFTGSPPATGVDAPLPDDMEGRLSEMTIFGQFDAVRKAHQAIAEHGTTVELLGALARGYANLGQLTRFQWTTTSDVFTARSLLYAQRMYITDPDLALSHWTRAYCLAMAGLHAGALKDLDAAKGADNPPAWVAMTDAMCHYDTEKLLNLAGTADKRYQVLGEYMAFLTVENSGCQGLTNRVGEFVLESTPFCDRVTDAMCNTSGVSYLHSLTSDPFTSSVALYRQELPRIADLPKSVSDAWNAAHTNPDLNADIASVSQAFVDSTEQTEPSWPALGKMLRESNFVHVFRRAYFLANFYGGDPTDEIRRMSALSKGHPMASLIEGIGDVFRNQPVPDELKTFSFQDVTFRWSWPMNPWNILVHGRSDFSDFQHIEIAHANDTAWDYERTMTPGNYQITNSPTAHATFLPGISPFSPAGPATLIANALSHQNPDQYVADLAAKSSKFAMVNSATGNYYIGRRQYANAIAAMQAYVKQSPDRWGYQRLANCYLQSNDEANWLATLTDSLKLEDFGLDHAQTQDGIARHFMGQMNYNKALPYAQAAAESGASWAEMSLAECESGLGNWADAEDIMQSENNQYSNKGCWYLWCWISGHGDVNSARRVAAAYAQEHLDVWTSGLFYRGENDAANELKAAQSDFSNHTGDIVAGLWLAMVQDQAGDETGKVQTLQRLAIRRSTDPTDMVYSQCAGWLMTRKSVTMSLADDARMLQSFLDSAKADGEETQAVVQCFVGYYMLQHGDKERGMELLKFSALHSSFQSTAGFISRLELLKQGIDPYHPTDPATKPAP